MFSYDLAYRTMPNTRSYLYHIVGLIKYNFNKGGQQWQKEFMGVIKRIYLNSAYYIILQNQDIIFIIHLTFFIYLLRN